MRSADNTMTAVSAAPTVRQSGRISQLDGLRGLAALIVVVHHSLLVAPALAQAYGAGRSDLTGLSGWLTHTPLHLVWDGPAAVFIWWGLPPPR